VTDELVGAVDEMDVHFGSIKSRAARPKGDRRASIIARLRSREEIRCLRWRCNTGGHMKNFTRPMPAHLAPPCPKCKGVNFHAVP
jgi:hypothetical protein